MAVKIFGTGLGRTGTMSLKLALEYLEGNPSFHMVDLMQFPERLKHLKGKPTSINWEALLEGFSSTVDYPTCLFYKEVLEKFPDAKFIHTHRKAESWYNSVRETIYRGKPKGFSDVT